MNSRPRPNGELSQVYARGEGVRPRVSQPNSPWTLVAGVAGVAVLGLFAFTSLSNGRAARAETAARHAAVVTPAAPSALPPAMTLAQNQMATPGPTPAAPAPSAVASVPPASDLPDPNLRAPAMVVDLNDAANAPAAARLGAPPAAAPTTPEDQRLNAEERFAARVSGSTADTARAVQMRDLSRTIPQGFVIPAVLETAIDSDLPGSVRAVVSRDVRGFDGQQVLIPRGSKVIGQYRSAVSQGQTRAFVVWSRIITPQGVSIDVGSPATDTLGRGGIAGRADTHFMQRFGSAILLSVISAGVEAAGRSHGDTTSVVIGSSSQANQVASIALQKQIDIPPTIRVAQGVPVQVSVARDLDFSGVAALR